MAVTQTIPCGATPTVLLGRTDGDLTVRGWNEPQIGIRCSSPDDVQITTSDGAIEIVCNGDCTLTAPSAATLDIHGVSGDCHVNHLGGDLTIAHVGGDLHLHDIGRAAVGEINGDLLARDLRRDLLVERVGGDASVSHARGDVTLGRVDDDLTVINVQGSLEATAGDDASLRLRPTAGKRYAVDVGGDLVCRLPADASAQVRFSCGGQATVRGLETSMAAGEQAGSFTLGAGEAQLTLAAQGDLALVGQDGGWGDAGDFGADLGAEYAGQAARLAEQVAGQIESQLQTLGRRLEEKLGRLDGEEISAQVQQRVQKAMTLAEEKIASALRTAEEQANQANRDWTAGGPYPRRYSPPKQEKPKAGGVSAEERLTILRMVSEGKLSVEQAEKLLAALKK